MAPLNLLESVHPSKQAQERFDGLLGIDTQKQQLRDELLLLLAPERLEQWLKRHHLDGLPLAESARRSTPLVILSGEVGCGKTALAASVGTPVAKELGSKVVVLETPSDIRGTGMVGELSARITDAFSQVLLSTRSRVRLFGGPPIGVEQPSKRNIVDQRLVNSRFCAGVGSMWRLASARNQGSFAPWSTP